MVHGFLISLLVTFPADDHDFGLNDGHRYYVHKEAALQLLADFLGEPADSTLRRQNGAWSARTITTPSNHTVRIILLDNRSHKEPWSKAHILLRNYAKGPQDMLGDEQWRWLENELRSTRADVTLIGTGIQVVANDKFLAEGFYRFPGAYVI